jgi:hypothetical protein
VAVPCEYNNEIWGPINRGEFHEEMSDSQFVKKGSAPWN